MTRSLMTEGEIRVANLLDDFLIGQKRLRYKNDKPDYINDLNNGKSLGLEIVEFTPFLNNGDSILSIENPILKLDNELYKKFGQQIDKDYYVRFCVKKSKLFLKDKKMIENILNTTNYNSLIACNFILQGNNELQIIPTNYLSASYRGITLEESLEEVNIDINQNLVDWLSHHLIIKNTKISGYEKTDLIGLAISDLYYSQIFDNNDNAETEQRWKRAYKDFSENNLVNILFDYIYIITHNKVIQIKY